MMVEATTTAQHIEQVIRKYIQACNDADVQAIAACFCSEAAHYFPWTPKWSGATAIGNNFAKIVREEGVSWTVDQLLIDVHQCAAALEWTAFNRQHVRIVRGVDWFVFEPHTFHIQEVRSYVAAPIHPDTPRQELRGFDYAGRGYPTTFPDKN